MRQTSILTTVWLPVWFIFKRRYTLDNVIQIKNCFMFSCVHSQKKGKENSSFSYYGKNMGCNSYGYGIKGFGSSRHESPHDRQNCIGHCRHHRPQETLQSRPSRSPHLWSSGNGTPCRSPRPNLQYRPLRVSLARLQSLCEQSKLKTSDHGKQKKKSDTVKNKEKLTKWNFFFLCIKEWESN